MHLKLARYSRLKFQGIPLTHYAWPNPLLAIPKTDTKKTFCVFVSGSLDARISPLPARQKRSSIGIMNQALHFCLNFDEADMLTL